MMAALVTGVPSPVSPAPFRLERFGSLDAPASAGFVSSYLGASSQAPGSGPTSR
jgi:hypothetical protein